MSQSNRGAAQVSMMWAIAFLVIALVSIFVAFSTSGKLKEAIALMPSTLRNLKLILEGGGSAANENDAFLKLFRVIVALKQIF